MRGYIALQKQSVQKAQDANLGSRSLGVRMLPRAAFILSAAPSPVASEARSFRDEHR